MQLQWYPPSGGSISLDADPRWRLLGLAGHGAPDSRLQTAASPGRDELLGLHAAAQPRLISLSLRIVGTGLAAYEQNRAALAAAFAPWSAPGTAAAPGRLEATLADGRVRALRAYCRAGLGWSSGHQRGAASRETLLLEAPDPFWYDPSTVEGSAQVQPPGGWPFNEVDQLAFPGGFGSDGPSVRLQLTNAGSVRTHLALELPGPVTDPSLRRDEAAVAFSLIVPQGLTLEVVLGPQADGSADAPRAALVDALGVRTNVLNALRPGARFWSLDPGPNSVAVEQASPEGGGNSVRYRYLQREIAI